jgi:hypothetical protein
MNAVNPQMLGAEHKPGWREGMTRPLRLPNERLRADKCRFLRSGFQPLFQRWFFHAVLGGFLMLCLDVDLRPILAVYSGRLSTGNCHH